MADKPIHIPREWAEEIVSNEAVCHSEGMGGRMGDVLQWIADHYPDIRERYSDRVEWPKFSSDLSPRPGQVVAGE